MIFDRKAVFLERRSDAAPRSSGTGDAKSVADHIFPERFRRDVFMFWT